MRTDRNRKIIMAALIAVAVLGMIVGYIVLPDILIMQFSAGGAVSNTMPKLLGLAIPAAIIVFGAIRFYGNGDGGSIWRKGLLISAAGVLAFVLLFVFNL